ncbi:MAG: ABC transporter substrate-binding protein [Neomegalonema sp.]|nr:ABC transporter substrate-binding protein [Neomegalonema sp.]
MKRLTTAAIAAAAILAAGVASAKDVKFGFLGGFTGPIETLTPPIFSGAKIAFDEINKAGGLTAGKAVLVQGDTGCSDTTLAVSSADRLVNTESVLGIVGALCSGATIAGANNAAIPGGVVMISPASTSPAVTELADKDLVFRTVSSDSYQGEMLAKLLMSKGVKTIAVTYLNNDYGKGFATALTASYKKMGGKVVMSAPHEDGKADYRPEIGALEAAGAETLVVLAYADGSGQTIVRQAIESGVFQQLVGGDGMVGDSLIKAVGADAIASMIATKPGAPEVKGKAAFEKAAKAAGVDPKGVFVAQAYDAAFLLALAAEKAGGDKTKMSAALREVASAPGEVILPGEWAKAKKLLAEGKDINYEGAVGSHEFDPKGDVPGVIVEMAIKDGEFKEVGEVK